MKPCYVWTLDLGNKVYCHFEGTRRECENYIKSRWGHFPPWAIVSTISSHEKFAKKYLNI